MPWNVLRKQEREARERANIPPRKCSTTLVITWEKMPFLGSSRKTRGNSRVAGERECGELLAFQHKKTKTIIKSRYSTEHVDKADTHRDYFSPLFEHKEDFVTQRVNRRQLTRDKRSSTPVYYLHQPTNPFYYTNEVTNPTKKTTATHVVLSRHLWRVKVRVVAAP